MTQFSRHEKTDVLVHTMGDREASQRKVVQQLQELEDPKTPHPFWSGKLFDDNHEGLNFRQLLVVLGLTIGATCISTFEHKQETSCIDIKGNNNTVVVEGVVASSCNLPSKMKP